MKKFFLSLTLFAASGAYAASQYMGGSTTVSVVAPSAPAPVAQQSPTPTTTLVASTGGSAQSQPAQVQPAPQSTPTPIPAPTPTPAPAPAPKPKGQYVDGTYTGTPADAYYGTVQIRATVQGGKLTDVTFLQYPNDRRTSQYINSQAMPQLQQEAIAAQSANVDVVSGATDTSDAFIQSLSDALSKAKNG